MHLGHLGQQSRQLVSDLFGEANIEGSASGPPAGHNVWPKSLRYLVDGKGW